MEMIGVASLLRMMPMGYEEACYSTKAIVRNRGIKDPNDLMMLALFHLLTGCSLVEVSEISKLAKLGDISDVAFMKRFNNCTEWFKWVLTVEVYHKGAVDKLTITSNSVGEHLRNFALSEGDLVLADRIYSSVTGIEYCQEVGCQFVARMRINSFRPYDVNGNQMDLLSYMRGTESGELYVYARKERGENAGKLYPVRICFKKKTAGAIESTRKKMKRKESKKQAKIATDTFAFNEYLVVATSLGSDYMADEILDLYRYRWQVELYFKRLKSILNYGELPKNPRKAYLHG